MTEEKQTLWEIDALVRGHQPDNSLLWRLENGHSSESEDDEIYARTFRVVSPAEDLAVTWVKAATKNIKSSVILRPARPKKIDAFISGVTDLSSLLDEEVE